MNVFEDVQVIIDDSGIEDVEDCHHDEDVEDICHMAGGPVKSLHVISILGIS